MHLANSVGPDQTARMRRLIWVYAGRKCDKVPFLINWLRYTVWSLVKLSFFLQCFSLNFTVCIKMPALFY